MKNDTDRMMRRIEAFELFMWSMEHDFEVFEDGDFDMPGMGKYTWEKLQKWKKEIDSYTERGEYLS
jgi:hypothetical protein